APTSTAFRYTTLFRSVWGGDRHAGRCAERVPGRAVGGAAMGGQAGPVGSGRILGVLVSGLPHAVLAGSLPVRCGRGLYAAGAVRPGGDGGRRDAAAHLQPRGAARLPGELPRQLPGDDFGADAGGGAPAVPLPVGRTALRRAVAVQPA